MLLGKMTFLLFSIHTMTKMNILNIFDTSVFDDLKRAIVVTIVMSKS